MERRSFLGALLALFLPAPELAVRCPPAAPVFAKRTPFILRCISPFITVEPVGFGGFARSRSPRDYRASVAHLMPWQPEEKMAEVWERRLLRRSRYRVSVEEISRAIPELS